MTADNATRMNSKTRLIEQLIANTRRRLNRGLAEVEAGADLLMVIPHVQRARDSLAEAERAIRRDERARIMARARDRLDHATTDGERTRIMQQAVEAVLATMTPEERATLLTAAGR